MTAPNDERFTAGQDRRSNVLGVGISVLNLPSATDRVFEAVYEGRKGYVCVTGVHGVIEAQSDPEFRRMLNDSFLTTPDGMPMVWMGKINGFKEMDRVYGPDLMAEVCRRSAETGNTHYLYGGGDGVVEELAAALENRFPGIRIIGKYTPPFRPLNGDEESALVAELAEKKPDFFWVGLSTPKQERFMDAYLDKLDTRIMFGVGAAFDFHAGKVKQAPRWIQRSGFEWLYRTCKEPRRLWKRYAVNNTRFLWKISLQLLHITKTPLPER
jgi:N-acetylglucosaminyldiphosphoundecaprenol N-acetyl-beta-D-mannosaminyltransferase